MPQEDSKVASRGFLGCLRGAADNGVGNLNLKLPNYLSNFNTHNGVNWKGQTHVGVSWVGCPYNILIAGKFLRQVIQKLQFFTKFYLAPTKFTLCLPLVGDLEEPGCAEVSQGKLWENPQQLPHGQQVKSPQELPEFSGD